MREILLVSPRWEPTVNGVCALELIPLMLSLKAPLELPEVIITQGVSETIRVS
jgi:hypothetical protein